jgi:hypothetical protein
MLFFNQKGLLMALNKYGIYNWMPDEMFLKMMYRLRIGKKLNIKEPRTFNEKLQWLKLNDRKPEYIQMVDKFGVYKYIADAIGEKHLIPLLGVYDSFEEIDFNVLPNQFILKCSHDSGSFLICKDKANFDFITAKNKLNKRLKRNLFWHGREWPYKGVKPKIICQKFLEDEIFDYKFYCFNGEPKFLYVAQGDNTKGTLRMNFYDLKWRRCPFYREDHEALLAEVVKPSNFEEMTQIAKRLCKGMIFVRVDLFYVDNQIYFGELTFSPGSGFTPFSPENYEKEIGSWITLPSEKC